MTGPIVINLMFNSFPMILIYFTIVSFCIFIIRKFKGS